ncbi:hypothetical protein AVEN_130774-1 [Araneus ventricosus]|uniref:Uncharacterized protein n=1 Tax=Araneus ventricosus TaxID=182803 RepID=A0A4Y2GIE1_ARAVE|nr:hypothetical protein AVEN_130774-1 [Araneus ventricosus]
MWAGTLFRLQQTHYCPTVRDDSDTICVWFEVLGKSGNISSGKRLIYFARGRILLLFGRVILATSLVTVDLSGPDPRKKRT